LKQYEKKSFLTTSLLFFLPLSVFVSIILYMYYEDKVKNVEVKVLYEMKDYTFDFKSKNFILDIVENKEDKKLFKIYPCQKSLCAYFEMPSATPYLLKVVYKQKELALSYSKILDKIIKISLFSFSFLLILSMAFAYYSMRPMKEALHFLEDFLKDLIHDLNTPATSILLNVRLLKKRENSKEIQRIEVAAKNISFLYKNLEFINPNSISKEDNININHLISEKITLFEKLYPHLNFVNEKKDFYIKSNLIALDRILDNLISNACKYNIKNGQVNIAIKNNTLIIEDTGIGIKNINKVFQRYYKENETGLGIGMSIVKQLCEGLDIKILITSEENLGTKLVLTFD